MKPKLELAEIKGIAEREGGLDVLKGMLTEYTTELEGHISAKADLENKIEQYNELWEIDKETFELQLEGDNLTVTNPAMKFQADPRYLDIQKRLTFKKYKSQQEKVDHTKKDLQKQLDNTIEQISHFETMIPLVREEIGEENDE